LLLSRLYANVNALSSLSWRVGHYPRSARKIAPPPTFKTVAPPLVKLHVLNSQRRRRFCLFRSWANLSSKDSTVCWCMTGHARVGVRGEGTGTPLGVKWFLACQPCRRDSFPKLRWMESAQRRSQTLREMIFFNGNSRTFY